MVPRAPAAPHDQSRPRPEWRYELRGAAVRAPVGRALVARGVDGAGPQVVGAVGDVVVDVVKKPSSRRVTSTDRHVRPPRRRTSISPAAIADVASDAATTTRAGCSGSAAAIVELRSVLVEAQMHGRGGGQRAGVAGGVAEPEPEGPISRRGHGQAIDRVELRTAALSMHAGAGLPLAELVGGTGDRRRIVSGVHPRSPKRFRARQPSPPTTPSPSGTAGGELSSSTAVCLGRVASGVDRLNRKRVAAVRHRGGTYAERRRSVRTRNWLACRRRTAPSEP